MKVGPGRRVICQGVCGCAEEGQKIKIYDAGPAQIFCPMNLYLGRPRMYSTSDLQAILIAYKTCGRSVNIRPCLLIQPLGLFPCLKPIL